MHRLCKWKDFFFPDRVFLDDTLLLLSFANPCWAYQLWPSQHRAGLWEGRAKITETPALVWSAILVARVGHSAFWRTICPPAAQSQAAKTKQKPAIGQLAHRVSRLRWQHERALVPGADRVTASHLKNRSAWLTLFVSLLHLYMSCTALVFTSAGRLLVASILLAINHVSILT